MNPVFAKGKCNRGRGEKIISDIEAVEEIDQFNNDLHQKLKIRESAIKNWKRLKIVIVILKMTGGRVDDTQKNFK